MNRKTLITCISAVAGMALVIVLAIVVLYSGTGSTKQEDKAPVLNQAKYSLFAAVPSDAMIVTSFSSVKNVSSDAVSQFQELNQLVGDIRKANLTGVLDNPMTVSVHYSGQLQSLYLFDMRDIPEGEQALLETNLAKRGLNTEQVEYIMFASHSKGILMSGVRHFEQQLSVLDSPGFISAVQSVDNDDIMLISCVQARNFMKILFPKMAAKYAGFFESLADWYATEIKSDAQVPVSLAGNLLADGEVSEFLNVLKNCKPSRSEMGKILPSYTVFAASLPMDDIDSYVTAYKDYLDSQQLLPAYTSAQKALEERTGISPEVFFKRIAVDEVVTASFFAGNKMETVNLIRTGCKEEDLESLIKCDSKSNEWPYESYVSSVFGNLFDLEDESYYTYKDGWIISGSSRAVDEFVTNGAWKYTIDAYLSDAGGNDIWDTSKSLFVAYSSLSESGMRLSDYVGDKLKRVITSIYDGADYCPAVLIVNKEDDEVKVSFDIHKLKVTKTRAPQYDRDSSVEVPEGPFKVKNTRTGKMNTFYQNSSLAICLRNENGKDMWGVPLGKPICGTAQTVDFYKNNKLQILFGAGTQVYLIDILGRYVSGFPIDLKREIAVGPDVYDFAGAGNYNIVVLHKDNTIQMYNLQGRVPASWKGITAKETIKALPERLKIGKSDFWIVRTSIQTLIFPFYGGEPITKFTGDERIRPDSSVELKGDSVEVSCYDGKKRIVKLD